MENFVSVLFYYENEVDFQKVKQANSDILYEYKDWKVFSERAISSDGCKIYVADIDKYLSFLKDFSLMNTTKVRAAYAAASGNINKTDIQLLYGIE